MKVSERSIWATTGALLFLLALSGCHVVYEGSDTVYIPDTGGGPVYVDPYKRAWYDVYGTKCISNGYPMSGCNFYADGTKIRSSGDPFYSSLTLYYDYWTYTDSYGDRRTYQGYAWLSNTGILYNDSGDALNEIDQDSLESADLISAVAEQELETAKQAGHELADKYALAEEAGVKIAKTLQDWATIGRSRSRTPQDIADFSQRLYGVSLNKASSAIINAAKGDKKQLDEINIDVAAHWGTSPETSKQILSKWYKNELSQLGVK